jgi:hypothetical protein
MAELNRTISTMSPCSLKNPFSEATKRGSDWRTGIVPNLIGGGGIGFCAGLSNEWPLTGIMHAHRSMRITENFANFMNKTSSFVI